ncbi:GNAT family N-acetyltransferase [Dysgonomonas sp. OttesenSCG-928-M03]|nr:GNAT family N-acetyltransferase [Dysgonomonas sp. OttesenSCG-928-M03]
MKNIEIRKVKPNDIRDLQRISRQTFSETYSGLNTEEDMKKYLAENLSLENLASEIDNKDSEFYFAVSDNDIVGFLKLNFNGAQTELMDDDTLEIERIYVLKEYQGKNVGKLFYEKAIEIAQQVYAVYVWLGVWEKNLKAIAFYKKNGFVEFGKHIFKLGNDEQTDIMMKLQLKDNL